MDDFTSFKYARNVQNSRSGCKYRPPGPPYILFYASNGNTVWQDHNVADNEDDDDDYDNDDEDGANHDDDYVIDRSFCGIAFYLDLLFVKVVSLCKVRFC